jgi:hypothetical protein
MQKEISRVAVLTYSNQFWSKYNIKITHRKDRSLFYECITHKAIIFFLYYYYYYYYYYTLSRSLVTVTWRILKLQVKETAANILTKESRTVDKGWYA